MTVDIPITTPQSDASHQLPRTENTQSAFTSSRPDALASFCNQAYHEPRRTASLFQCLFWATLIFETVKAADGEIESFPGTVSDKAILDKLINSTHYDKRIRPDDVTLIDVNIMLHSLSSPDESSLSYEVEFLLHRRWTDKRLQFNDGGRHNYLNGMSHVKDVWLPDTYIVKHGSLKEPLVDMSLKIYRNGTVLHILRRSISINCQGNLKIFPFDNPKCPFAIESVSLQEDEMQLRWSKDVKALRAASSILSFNAYLVESEVGECGEIYTWRGNFSCLHVLMIFTRDKNYYFSSVFVPGIILVSSAFISFWLDKTVVPARVMIGVTTMLSFCTTTNNFRSSLPVVSNLTAMNLWDGVCMFFIYTSLLEFVFVNYLHRKPPKYPPHENQMLSRNGSKNGSSQVGPESSVKDVTPEVKEHPRSLRGDNSKFAWIMVQAMRPRRDMSSQEWSNRIENTAKVVFPTIFLLFVLIYFITFAAIMPAQYDNWSLSSPERQPPIRSNIR